MNQMGLHRPCSHHHPVQTFHEISDDKFISPKARMNINFVSQGLGCEAVLDSQTPDDLQPDKRKQIHNKDTSRTMPRSDSFVPSVARKS